MAKSRNKADSSNLEETEAVEELQTENTETVSTPQQENTEALKAPQTESTEPIGTFVYLGPSIRGVIQNATIFKDTPDRVIQSLSAMIENNPNAKKLIVHIRKLMVPSSQISAIKAKIKQCSNSYSHDYKELLK